jgi:hypothetical protein
MERNDQTGLLVYTETDPMIRCACGEEAPYRDVVVDGRVVDLRVFPCKDPACDYPGIPSVVRLRREAAEEI